MDIVEIDAGESLIDHVHHHRYECKDGYCGQCAVTVLSGKVGVVEGKDALAIRKNEALPCVCIALTKLRVLIE